MKKYIKLRIVVCLCLLSVFSKAQEKVLLKSIPHEDVHLNTNSKVFLVGETLLYSFFSVLSTNNTPSFVSKIGYVELIGENGNLLFKHKLKLTKGVGFSDYFIPSNVKTGQYKLIAYTKWIDNSDSFYVGNVYIINPFISNETNVENDTITEIQIAKPKYDEYKEDQNSIEIVTSSNSFKTRSLVSIELKNSFQDLYYGNYSLSVRKVSPIEIKNERRDGHIRLNQKNNFNMLPEVRGENISGIVKFKDKDTIVPDVIVSLSIPSKNYIFKNVKTNQLGRFNFNVYENFETSDVLVQIIDEQKADYKIILDDTSLIDYEALDSKKIKLNQNLKDWLEEQSISCQIENAYYESKKDSVFTGDPPNLFYGKAFNEYVLDDYTRFPTLKETFIEVIQAGAIRSSKEDFKFKVNHYSSDGYSFFDNYNPLVLFDGIFIQNEDDIMDYDVNNIESINLVRGTYFYGPSVFRGIIDIRSKKGDFNFLGNGNDMLNFRLESPRNSKIYYLPNYAENSNGLKRIPDKRIQLLWLPDIKLDSELKTIELYSSDEEGVFEIILEGFTYGGKHMVSKKYFNVKSN
jgi:hypothetical protein